MSRMIRSIRLFYVIILIVVMLTTVNVIFQWETANFFTYTALHLLGLLFISGGVIAEGSNERKVNYLCITGLLLLLIVQGSIKYSELSFQDFSFFIKIIQ
ncbi:hypothetical protein BAMA_17090 [Bacillus manliponensis]|uniref:Uncharacterized protein n=1 Tax=Bacillus manliponensis TaxID=574376 RepID=A0A073KCX6_9BACI|nr:hypothetical protein [Bacillus manliponensis]KEK20163.1 hypothetical protein BAMA_17090 [Bacillus manliponensis]